MHQDLAGKRLAFVCSDIGRGHPNYLDSAIRALGAIRPTLAAEAAYFTVFELSRGLSGRAWKLARLLYRAGGRGGWRTAAYNRLRGKQAGEPRGLSARLLARDVLRALEGFRGPVVVDHPLVARLLATRHTVHYVHGEVAAPAESAVPRAARIYVPLEETAKAMETHGVPRAALTVTGLMLEPELVPLARSSAAARMRRLEGTETLTVGFFASGAYPAPHLAAFLAGARACLDASLRVRLFWGTDVARARRLFAVVRRWTPLAELVIGDVGDDHPLSPLAIYAAPTRGEDTLDTVARLPLLDVACAAPHERVAWALGAGLPIVMPGFTAGSYAEENRRHVHAHGCGISLPDTRAWSNLGHLLLRLRRSGALYTMSELGSTEKRIYGADAVAGELNGLLGR